MPLELYDGPAHFCRFSNQAERVLFIARDFARKAGSESVGTDHLAMALLEEAEGPHADILSPPIPVPVIEKRQRIADKTGADSKS